MRSSSTRDRSASKSVRLYRSSSSCRPSAYIRTASTPLAVLGASPLSRSSRSSFRRTEVPKASRSSLYGSNVRIHHRRMVASSPPAASVRSKAAL